MSDEVLREVRELRADLRAVRQVLDHLLLAQVGERAPGLAALLKDAPAEEPETEEQKGEREEIEAFRKAFHEMTGEGWGVPDA